MQGEFEELVKPLIQYLQDNYHPHARIIIDWESAELVEGIKAFTISVPDDISVKPSLTIVEEAESENT
jgi:hypothetical protein